VPCFAKELCAVLNVPLPAALTTPWARHAQLVWRRALYRPPSDGWWMAAWFASCLLLSVDWWMAARRVRWWLFGELRLRSCSSGELGY
jgi:hypothetical protein